MPKRKYLRRVQPSSGDGAPKTDVQPVMVAKRRGRPPKQKTPKFKELIGRVVVLQGTSAQPIIGRLVGVERGVLVLKNRGAMNLDFENKKLTFVPVAFGRAPFSFITLGAFDISEADDWLMDGYSKFSAYYEQGLFWFETIEVEEPEKPASVVIAPTDKVIITEGRASVGASDVASTNGEETAVDTPSTGSTP